MASTPHNTPTRASGTSGDPPPPQPAPSVKTPTADSPIPQPLPGTADYEEFLVYRVAEKARKLVLAYFGLLGILVSLIITLWGWNGIQTLIQDKYTSAIEQERDQAKRQVADLVADLETQFARVRRQVESRSAQVNLQLSLTLDKARVAASRPAASECDLSASIGAVRDQMQTANTVGHALAYALQSEFERARNESVRVSARSIYAAANKRDIRQAQGASFDAALLALQQSGAYAEQDWPDDLKEPKPGTSPHYKITAWLRVPPKPESIRVYLCTGHAVVAAFKATDGMVNKVNADGKIPSADKSSPVGLVGVCFVAYEKSTDTFKFASTWGGRWGAAGFGFVSAEDLSRYVDQAYVLQIPEDGEPADAMLQSE